MGSLPAGKTVVVMDTVPPDITPVPSVVVPLVKVIDPVGPAGIVAVIVTVPP
jgi:hypothetical protein